MVASEGELVPFMYEYEGIPAPVDMDTVDLVGEEDDDGVAGVAGVADADTLPIADPHYTPGDEAFLPDPNDRRF